MNEETRKKIEEKDAEIADLEKDFDEANERVSSWQDKCQGLQSELSSLKSLLGRIHHPKDKAMTPQEQAEKFLGIVPGDENHQRQIDYLASLFQSFAVQRCEAFDKELNEAYKKLANEHFELQGKCEALEKENARKNELLKRANDAIGEAIRNGPVLTTDETQTNRLQQLLADIDNEIK